MKFHQHTRNRLSRSAREPYEITDLSVVWGILSMSAYSVSIAVAGCSGDSFDGRWATPSQRWRSSKGLISTLESFILWSLLCTNSWITRLFILRRLYCKAKENWPLIALGVKTLKLAICLCIVGYGPLQNCTTLTWTFSIRNLQAHATPGKKKHKSITLTLVRNIHIIYTSSLIKNKLLVQKELLLIAIKIYLHSRCIKGITSDPSVSSRSL